MSLSRSEAKERHRVADAAYRERNPERTKERYRRYNDGQRKEADRVQTFSRASGFRFVAFDGEGSYGRYQLLACSASPTDVRSSNGLGTLDCLSFFISLIQSGAITSSDALVGFGLGYDFENILRDVPDTDYKLLRMGKHVVFGEYGLDYVSRKFLDIEYATGDRTIRFRLQDIYPYFQTSFVKACEQRGIILPEQVYEGKRNRGGFRYKDIERIAEYNRLELIAMVDLAGSLRTDFVEAFKAVSITANLDKRSWYGPGAQALAVLQFAKMKQLERPSIRFAVDVLDTLEKSYGATLNSRPATILHRNPYRPNEALRRAYQSCMRHPFTVAYFGGRIEAAMQGRFDQPLYDYDLTSAYPYALTLLPDLSTSKLIPVTELDRGDRIGVYLVRWDYPPGSSAYYPFPYRSRSGNVYFPPSGYGWVLSPEVYAAPRSGCTVLRGWVYTDTEGYGRGNRRGDSRVSQLVSEMATRRVELKAAGNSAHRGLKLLMNSVYGKTLQKEGSRRFFNAFVAAWITSVTRSRIYSAIGMTSPGVIVSVMTDGILSTQVLPLALSENLGSWTMTMFGGGYQFAPGVYRLIRPDGTELLHYRGFLRFDAKKASEALDTGSQYVSSNPVFVSRVMAMHDRKVAKKAYQFVPISRKETFSLASKRDMERPQRMGDATYYPAKSTWENDVLVSWPYDAFGANVKVESDDVE